MVELSSLDVRALALELRPLEDAYVDKAYQTGPDRFVLKLRHPQHGPAHVVLRPGAFAARAAQAPATPESPTTVALTLRKLLANARLRRVDQHDFDRVLRFRFERRGEPLELVVELFGKGNLIVTDDAGIIKFALRTETFAHRTVRRGEALVFPPARVNPLTLPRSEFERLAQGSEKDTVRFVALDLALGGDLAEELVHRAGLDKGAKASALATKELDRLWDALRGLLDAPPAPAVVTTTKGVQVQSVPLEAPIFRDAQREPAPSLSEAVLRADALAADRVAPAADPEVARLERQIGHQERGAEELGKEADRWERRGHLLYAHYARAAHVLQKAKATLEAQGWGGLEARIERRVGEDDDWAQHVARVEAKRGRILLRLEEEDISLDPTQGLEANATLLYDESKRVRAKRESALAALEDARRRLQERRAQAQREATKPEAKARAPTKRFWFETLRWFYSSEGFLVVAGRDAASNEKLVKRHLKAGDRYAHADVQGAASVIVKAETGTPGPATLQEACQFAAVHSKAFNQFVAADAYWVLPEQVSKTAEAGEYVPKGAFIVRGARNYEHKLPLELAVGIVRLDAQGRLGGPDAPHPRLMAGPPNAVRTHARRTAIIERGDVKPSDAAKRLAPAFGVTLDEVIAALPAGTVRIRELPEGTA
jgi:predicted ribosome quality control (RQC) complex YloA/Tae2 family protein